MANKITGYIALLSIGLLLPQLCSSYDLLFVATKTVLRYFRLTDLDNRGTPIPVVNTKDVIALDYDPFEGYVYWADQALSIIARAKLDGSEEIVIVSELGTPGGLAIDVESRMIYWTDKENNVICRSHLNGMGKETLIKDNLNEPLSILVDTKNRKMYWLNSNPTQRIHQANLDGTDIRQVVNTSSHTPLLFTLDVDNERIYWIDKDQGTAMYSDLQGNSETTVFHGSFNARTMAVYGNILFVSILNNWIEYIWKYDMARGIFSTFVQLPNWPFYCIKPLTTEDGEDIVLLCEYEGLMEIDAALVNDLGNQIDELADVEIIGVDYDSNDDRIYWIDYSNDQVSSSYRNGTDLKHLASHEIENKDVMLISKDRVYWTDYNQYKLLSVPLNGGQPVTVLENLPYLRDFAIDNQNGYLYLLFAEPSNGKIDRVDLDGNNRRTLARGLSSPSNIVLDVPGHLMYYTENEINIIYVADLDGKKMGQLMGESKIEQMNVLGDYIYWFTYSIVGKTNRKTQTNSTILITKQELQFRSIRVLNDRDDCAENNCQNGATCVDDINVYNCTCAPGYFGVYCEADIDECKDNDCENGATCVDDINAYHCICVPGYVGDYCETDFDECGDNQCQNGATCVDDINGYNCTCAPGYFGVYCEADFDECKEHQCRHGATCIDDINAYHCICTPGYVGVYCETDIDECESNPCQNNGTCIDNINSYTCSCVPGFGDDLCEKDISECGSNPCQNGGTCIDEVNGYRCECRIGYIGDHCETGLGFVVGIIAFIAMSSTLACLTRRAIYQRRKKSNLASQGKTEMFSLVHLPPTPRGQLYRMNETGFM